MIMRFIKYWLNAIEEHSIHSPFLYELYTQVIKPDYPDPHFDKIEKMRDSLLEDHTQILINDLGAGSKRGHGNERTIAEIAKTSLSEIKLSKLLYRLIRHQESKEVLELGASLGINSLYMYAGNEKINFTTFEGDEALASQAKKIYERAGAGRIKLVKGNLDKTLSDYLAFSGKIDFAFIDANHTFDATIKYFNMLAKKSHDDSVIVIADINWSPGMSKAWDEIRKSPYVTLSIDIFHAGLVFFKPDISTQHYVLEF